MHHMKIWIDIRNSSKTKSEFCKNFVTYFIQKNTAHELTIYSDKSFIAEWNIVHWNYQSVFWEQVLFANKLFKDKNDLIFTFDDTFPLIYKNSVIQIIPSLENILYPNLENTKLIKKYSYLYTIKKNLKNDKKIVCFTENTKKELNEKLNIHEDKLICIPPFFPSSPENTSKVDAKALLWITNDYFIYDYNYPSNNNLKRVLEAIKELNKTQHIHLVILWNKNANNREIRELILQLELSNIVIFAWMPDSKELGSYYKQSRWVIYPIIYDNFPISLSNAIHYNTPIIASENSEILEIFWENITYFSPISVSSMKKNLQIFLDSNIHEADYSYVNNHYNLESFYNKLISLIDYVKLN